MLPNDPELLLRAVTKAHTSKCGPMPEPWEKAAVQILAMYQRRMENISVSFVINGKAEPLEPLTLEQCRWIVHDQMEAGARLRETE